MNNVNRTLYIPLYGKAFVSQKGIILNDPTAQMIWEKEGFSLKGKSRSKWLAYYMGMRAAIIDEWVATKIKQYPHATILHLGCGMDSRVHRVSHHQMWYDVDFKDVISERKKYFQETSYDFMIETDITNPQWLDKIQKSNHAIIIMEGLSMYLTPSQLNQLFKTFNQHFQTIDLIMDVYSTFAAKASKYKNPINDVDVTEVYGLDDPTQLPIGYVQELEMTTDQFISQLKMLERVIFKKRYAGNFAKKLYHLYTFQKN